MISPAVRERSEHASSLLTMVEMHRVELIAPLDRVFASSEHVDANALLTAHFNVVSDALALMQRADEAVQLEAGDDQQYRDARDASIARLGTILKDTQHLLEAAYSRKLAAAYGFRDETRRAPDLLREDAEGIVRSLRQRPLSEPSPYGFELDLVPLADRIETEVVALSGALEDVEREAREIRDALDERNAAMAAFDETFRAIAAILHSYFVLVGRPDLAAMVH